MRTSTMVIAALFVLTLLAACNRNAPADVAGHLRLAAQTSGGAHNAADWPNFRGPLASGLSPETGINKTWATTPPRMLWSQPMSDDGYAGPSVKNGVVYIVDHQTMQDVVRAFDLGTGAEKWRYSYIDALTANYGYSRATPSIDGDRVYVYSRLGKLICLSASDGKLIWQRDIIGEFHGKRPGWDMACSPLIDGKNIVVYAGGPDAAVVCVDKMTGATVWAGGGSDQPGYSTPVLATIGGVRQYVCMLLSSVDGVDTQSGKLLWSYPWKTGANVNAATPLVIDNSVFIASGYGHGCAMLDIVGSEAQVRWQNKEMVAHFSSPIYYNGHIYGTGDPGFLMCLDPATGTPLWKQPGFQKAGLVGVDGTIITFNGANGDLIMAGLTPDAYHELGRVTPLGGQSWTAPIVAEGKLVIRNKSMLAVLDLH